MVLCGARFFGNISPAPSAHGQHPQAAKRNACLARATGFVRRFLNDNYHMTHAGNRPRRDVRAENYGPCTNSGIKSQPRSKVIDECAATTSSYLDAPLAATPVPHSANGTYPWLCVFVRRKVG